VAFACVPPGGRAPGATDICVRAVGTETDRVVMQTPESEVEPGWSPDGQQIAFVRVNAGIFVVSHLGGPERKVSASGAQVGWMADGKSVLILDHEAEGGDGIYRIDLDTGKKRRLTFAPVGIGDRSFAVSPDGRTLAFVRVERPGVNDLHIVPISGGSARRLTDWNAIVWDVAWTHDGRELIYSTAGGLWRIPAQSARTEHGSPVAA